MLVKGMTMLMCPFAGVIYYVGYFFAYKILDTGEESDFSDLSPSKDRHNRILRPDVEEEIHSAIPLEEVFIVSTDSEKRRRLLEELKKDSIDNYSTIIKAFDNDDHETVHYAAAAVTNARAMFERDIREMDVQNQKCQNPVVTRDYAYYVLKYVNSGILDPIEIKEFRYLFIKIMVELENMGISLTDGDYANIVNQAILAEDLISAEKWAKQSYEGKYSETSFLNLLKVHYYMNDSARFFETLDALKKADVSLSREGLSLVQFFKKKSPAAWS
jgi:hypothetical protein